MRGPTERCRPVLLALTALAMVGCGGALSGPTGNQRPADFALTDTRGELVRLSDYLGTEVIVVNFWATWCGPCAGELRQLQRLYDSYGDDGFVVLAVAMDGPDSSAQVAPFARRHGLEFPVLLDSETRVVGMLNPKRAAPYSVLISRRGVIVSTTEGYSAGDEVGLEAAIRAELRRRVTADD